MRDCSFYHIKTINRINTTYDIFICAIFSVDSRNGDVEYWMKEGDNDNIGAMTIGVSSAFGTQVKEWDNLFIGYFC